MKKILSGLMLHHLIPIAISLVLIFLLDTFLSKGLKTESNEKILVTGVSKSVRGMYNNCSTSEAEIELMGSLQDKQKLNVFGSSELQDLPYSCFFFLPDSLGLKTTGFGHAYHQNLSIACELLAAGKHLDGANVCVILSPGWFQSEGTNIEAFLEFVRPNFLRAIIHDNSIPKSNKLHISHYVNDHFKDISNPSKELIYFKNMNLYEKAPWFLKTFTTYTESIIQEVKYDVVVKSPELAKRREPFDWNITRRRLQQEFLKTCANNEVFVDSAYYTHYLIKDGKQVDAPIEPVNIGQEFEDFKLVLEILARHKCKATFILQPLNPYIYRRLEYFNPVRSRIKTELAKYNFPLLDLFAANTKEYTPGILKDIMHPSNRGWIEMNAFLAKHYKSLYE